MREVIIKLGVIYKNGKIVSETEAKIIAEANNFEYVEDFINQYNGQFLTLDKFNHIVNE
jgi:hypothetical protein